MRLPRATRLARAADQRRAGWTYIIQAAIAYGIAYISAQHAAKKRGPLDDDKPTTLTTRGSYTPWHLGVRLVGPVFAFAAEREKRKEKANGKGLGGSKVDVWYETGWHLIGVGPCHALHGIVQAGEPIFQGPITSVSHPSGTTIDLGDEGVFTIYWGEQGQPINTVLGGVMGPSSRWPRCCYVFWRKKRLGSSPTWPILHYELERRPSGTILSNSQSWYPPTATLSGITYDIVDSNANANPDIGYLELEEIPDSNAIQAFEKLQPGRITLINGNALANGDYEVRRAVPVQVQVATATDEDGNMYPVYATRTRLFLSTGTLGADDNGTVSAYNFAKDDDANIAHCVADMLFAPVPAGLGLDPNGLEPWDLQSLEDWGVEAENLGLRSSILIAEGRHVAQELGSILQDHGILLPLDPGNDGRLTFRRIRKPTTTPRNFPESLLSDSASEREKLIGEPFANKLTFTFTDRILDYSDNTLMVRNDGSVSLGEYYRAQDVTIGSTTHFETAAILARQRAQEELGSRAKFSLKMLRGARTLVPGDPFTLEGFNRLLRTFEVDINPLDEEVTVEVMPDSYGIQRTDFDDVQGGTPDDTLDPVHDLFVGMEVPEALLTAEEMLLVVPRVRGHAQVHSASIHVSPDDSSYTQLGTEDGSAGGGFLDAGMPATDAYYQAQGPTYQAYGPDESSLLDLTGDDLSWSRGRQVAVFRGPENDVEIAFVRKVTALGGGQYRLDGLLRARYDTRRLEIAAEAEVFVFANDEFDTFSDLLLTPDADLYVKSQPAAVGGVLSLAAIPGQGFRMYGKGLRPITPESLHVYAPYVGAPSYGTGDDVSLRWGWSTSSSKSTGAGYQAAGAPIGAPTIKGSFLVELRTTGDTLVQSDTITDPFITYSNSVLAAAPISGGSFKVRVAHLNNGLSSRFVELTVTKV